MALQGPIPVEFGLVFPDGVYAAGGFEPVRDFDASSQRPVRPVEGQGKRAAAVAGGGHRRRRHARTRTVKVKVAAQVQPVLPNGPAGVPFVPVEFTGLTVTPYVTQAGKLGYSLKATGVRLTGPSGRSPGPDGGREAAA